MPKSQPVRRRIYPTIPEDLYRFLERDALEAHRPLQHHIAYVLDEYRKRKQGERKD